MSRAQIIGLTVVVLLAGLVLFLALRQRQPPVLPADADHARFINPNACLGACHGPSGSSPQDKNHTLRTDCTDCHGMP